MIKSIIIIELIILIIQYHDIPRLKKLIIILFNVDVFNKTISFKVEKCECH